MIPDCYDFDEWLLTLPCPYTDFLIEEGTITTLEDLDDIEYGRGLACLYVLMEHYNEGLEDALRILVHGGAGGLDLFKGTPIQYCQNDADNLGGVDNFINWENWYDFEALGQSVRADREEDYEGLDDEEVGRRFADDVGPDDFYFDYSAYAEYIVDQCGVFEFEFNGDTWTFASESSHYSEDPGLRIPPGHSPSCRHHSPYP